MTLFHATDKESNLIECPRRVFLLGLQRRRAKHFSVCRWYPQVFNQKKWNWIDER